MESLKEVLESPVSDRDNEEKERRDALRKSVITPSADTVAYLNRSRYPQEVG